MLYVKNEGKSDGKRLVTVAEWEQMKGSKPLKFQGFEASETCEVQSCTKSGSPGAAPGAAQAAGPGWIAGAVAGVVAVAVLLTFGNVLMEMFFNLIGV